MEADIYTLSTPSCAILRHLRIILRHFAPFCAIPRHSAPFCAIPRHSAPSYAILRHSAPSCAILRHPTPSYAICAILRHPARYPAPFCAIIHFYQMLNAVYISRYFPLYAFEIVYIIHNFLIKFLVIGCERNCPKAIVPIMELVHNPLSVQIPNKSALG